MVKESVTITNPTGLHLRPAGNLCKEAMKFKCRISFEHQGNITNAKSVLAVLGAGIKYGNTITFTCEGDDEREALAALIDFVKNGIGE